MKRLAILVLLLASPAHALTPAFPAEATETGNRDSDYDSYRLPMGRWDGTALPDRLVEGHVERRAWRLDAPGTETLALLAPLRDQLAAEGFETVFECETAACGGFDFRFATEVLPEPGMHVDLGDFRFVSAMKGEEALSILISRSAAAGFVQIIHVTPRETPAPVVTVPEPAPVEPVVESDLIARMLAEGHVVLADLRFESGSAVPVEDDLASLEGLANWLNGNPARSLALVGHTDTAGGMEANVAISRSRANAVRDLLVSRYGAPAGRIVADGIGYLAPLGPNTTPDGRERNRRVEAVVVSTE